ncbi:hypothetical protein JIN84_20565 [Luteolibacter yonseiensis]|uniref:Aspartyl beta-hydroxylase n=1 Tax=Luteolibacter yonseiensis TaxID=1144680 RepID=A0A934R429_9BACT|nr:sulfotransferase [Luteolibacter yonseiensis]MBK1818028.1 hypothetical protein [Luteolibacter yonseiensis]
MSLPDLQGWLPVGITRHTSEPLVDWCRMGSRRFTEPFFDHSVEAAMQEPFNLLFRHQLPLDSLIEWQERSPGPVPDGFIFHMSRCGSTLVSRMLAALPGHIVLSEPPPLDALLRTDLRGADDEIRIAWLRAWVGIMGRPRNGERGLFVKLDAWHVFDLPLLRRAFPDTPWIFLYRNPVEVMVSAIGNPGMHLVPGMIGVTVPGIDPDEAMRMPQAEYIARVLAAVMLAGLEHLGPLGGKAINYDSLPEGVFSSIAPHFGLSLSPARMEAMKAVTAFHAKAPCFNFEPDSESKRNAAGGEVTALCAALLNPIYEQLRKLSE